VEKAAMNILLTTLRAQYVAAVKWIKANKLEFFLIISVLLIGAYLRLYRISEYMTFLGDEGRDAIIVRRLLVNFDPILIGPGTSIGNMYLGPLYYYLMAPALLFANFSPVGPSIMVAILSIATIWLVWFIAREWFPKEKSKENGLKSLNIGALFAALLYAIAPVVIVYSRSSWNPNVMPFFALLAVYSIWKVWQDKKYNWLVITGISAAFILQSHYLGLLLLPVLGLFWALTWLNNKKTKSKDKIFLKRTLLAGIIFAFLMSPLLIFDIRHGWINFQAMETFFTDRQTTVSARPWSGIPKLGIIFEDVVNRLVAGTDENVGYWYTRIFALLIGLITFQLIRKGIKTKTHAAYFLLVVWLGFSLIGLSAYKQHIYDHYYGIFFPALFILAGGALQYLWNTNYKSGKIIAGLILLPLILASLQNNPLKHPPNRQMQRSDEVAIKIIEEAGGAKFNFAVIAERNYEGAYQYFLERRNAPFVIIDPLRIDETLAEQLFVVCEMPKEKCEPTTNPKSEVANFGWSKVDGEWEVSGTNLFKLVHTK
jgi:4-amino-4-deoxy-L-arabinose transferase-like glycosyltransferase